jgi:hypothetical protein
MDRRGRLVFLGLGLVVGATAGAGAVVIARVAAIDRPPAATHPAATPGDEPRGATDASPLATPPSERVAAQREAPAATVQLLFGPVQRAHGEAGLKKGWARERHDPMPDDDLATGMARYEALVRDAPESIGADLARARTKSEQALADSKSGGLFALLDALGKGGVAPPVDAVRNRGRFDSFFPRQTAEGFVDGPSHKKHPGKVVENGSTLNFPAGVFLIEDLMSDRHPFPDDVTVAGAGMDATLLVLNGDMYTSDGLNRFTIRDCTVFTDSHSLFDMREKPASATLLRSRFIGFDSGAGGSSLIDAVERGIALRVEDCRIEGGYGRHQDGQLLDVRTDALLARFERCRFSELSMRMEFWHPGATVVFLGCTFEDLLDGTDLTRHGATNPGVLFDGCSFAYLLGPDRANLPKKDLNTLFPDWRARMNQ